MTGRWAESFACRSSGSRTDSRSGTGGRGQHRPTCENGPGTDEISPCHGPMGTRSLCTAAATDTPPIDHRLDPQYRSPGDGPPFCDDLHRTMNVVIGEVLSGGEQTGTTTKSPRRGRRAPMPPGSASVRLVSH